MQTMEMKDLEVGWWGLFDPIYGPEKVLHINHFTLRDPTGPAPLYGVGVNVLHLHVTDERGDQPVGRFITRAEHEPVLAMTFPDRRPSDADLEIAEGGLVEGARSCCGSRRRCVWERSERPDVRSERPDVRGESRAMSDSERAKTGTGEQSWESVDDAAIPGYVWCGHGEAKDTQVIVVTARRGKRLRVRRLTGAMAGKDIMVSRDQLRAAFKPLAAQCGRMMVGSGGDTYDPICELPRGHRGPCRSSAAIDQHRIGRV